MCSIIKNNIGIITSCLMVSLSSVISLISFTSECTEDNKERNEILNKSLSVSLIVFSLMSSVLERHLNKKLISTENENEELKTELSKSKRGDDDRDEHIDQEQEQGLDIIIDNNEPDSVKSEKTYYPPAVKIYS